VSPTTAYLDGSAAVKLMRPEPETAALVEALRPLASRVSSELLDVELRCVAHRAGLPVDRAHDVLAGVDLLPFSAAVRARAGQVFAPPQRALDALHLASALDLALDGLVFVTYDQHQAAAAEYDGLAVLWPA
jgi:hypothetical protein